MPFVFPVPISRQRTFFFFLSLCLEVRESFRKVILPRITGVHRGMEERGRKWLVKKKSFLAKEGFES